MKDISIQVDDATLAKAESFASANNTSVSALLLNYLHDVTSNGSSRSSAVKRLIELSHSTHGEVGEKKWTRDDLYGR